MRKASIPMLAVVALVSALLAAFSYGLAFNGERMPVTNLLAAILFIWLGLANYKEGYSRFAWLLMSVAALYSLGLAGIALGYLH